MSSAPPVRGLLHHVEVWVPDLAAARSHWGWLLGELGYQPFQTWEDGLSYRLGPTYLVLEQSPAMSSDVHDRMRPGVNHLAFHAGTTDDVDRFAREGAEHGWQLLFPDRHPHAGGPYQYAAYLVDEAGYEVELVAA